LAALELLLIFEAVRHPYHQSRYRLPSEGALGSHQDWRWLLTSYQYFNQAARLSFHPSNQPDLPSDFIFVLLDRFLFWCFLGFGAGCYRQTQFSILFESFSALFDHYPPFLFCPSSSFY